MATVYRAEFARCGGVWARVGLNTCIGCSNFAVGPAHVPFWHRRRDDGLHLLQDVEQLPGREIAAAAVRDIIAKANAVLIRVHSSTSA
jgi:hypothetical protein